MPGILADGARTLNGAAPMWVGSSTVPVPDVSGCPASARRGRRRRRTVGRHPRERRNAGDLRRMHRWFERPERRHCATPDRRNIAGRGDQPRRLHHRHAGHAQWRGDLLSHTDGRQHRRRRGASAHRGATVVDVPVARPVVFSPDDRFVTLPTSSVGELQIWRLAPTPDSVGATGSRARRRSSAERLFPMRRPSWWRPHPALRAWWNVRPAVGSASNFPAPSSGTDDCAVVSPVEFVGSGDHVAAVAYDRRCRPQSIVLSDLDGSHRRVLRVPRCAWTGSFGVSTNGHLLVAGCMRDTSTASVPLIARLDIGKRRPRLISVDRVDIRPDQITVDADGQGVATGEADRAGGAFQSLSFRGGHVLRGEVDHANGNFIGSAAFAPNGTTFATGFSDGRLRLWESSADGLRAVDLTENGPTGVTSLAFSPDGGELAGR